MAKAFYHALPILADEYNAMVFFSWHTVWRATKEQCSSTCIAVSTSNVAWVDVFDCVCHLSKKKKTIHYSWYVASRNYFTFTWLYEYKYKYMPIDLRMKKKNIQMGRITMKWNWEIHLICVCIANKFILTN